MKTELLDCGHVPTPQTGIGTGYGTLPDGTKHCYTCCASREREQMRKTGRATLYLSMTGDAHTPEGNSLVRPIPGRRYYGSHKVTDWVGHLNLPVNVIYVGRHNIARYRYDFWFTFENETWHGVQYGNNTQIAHCKRLKTGTQRQSA